MSDNRIERRDTEKGNVLIRNTGAEQILDVRD